MKKFTALLLAFLLVLSMTACGSGSDTETGDDTDETAEEAGEETESEEETAASGKVTIDETELFNNGSVIVTATELTSGILGEEISLTVVNNTEADLNVYLEDVVVNGYSLTTSGGYVDVGAGKTAYDCIYLYSSDLESSGIDTIAAVSFQIRLIDDDTYETLETSDRIEIVTSAGADYEQAVDDSGTVVCELDGIRVVYQGTSEDTIWDGELVFFVENSTENDIYVYADNVSIDNVMADASFGADVLAGTKCVDSLYVLSIEDLGIESMEEAVSITFTLAIVNDDNFNTIAEQDVELSIWE